MGRIGAAPPGPHTRALLFVGLALGAGLMGALDTIVFHQLAQWHHFYVHTHTRGQIVSDGLLHAGTTTLFVGSWALLWSWRRTLPGRWTALAGATLLGMGAFQLWDGTVHHLLLRWHPVRVGVTPHWPYDVAWNAGALALLAVGGWLWRRARPRDARSGQGGYDRGETAEENDR